VLTLFVAYSYFSPLAMQSQLSLGDNAMRVIAHFGPVVPPYLVWLGLKHNQVWAWYAGILYVSVLFVLGLYLSIEHIVYLIHGHLIVPTFLLLSVIVLPSLTLLLKQKMRVLRQLRGLE